MFSPVEAATWAGLGVAATLVGAYVAARNGWLQISIMREAHALNVSKAVPRIGCHVTPAEQNDIGPGFNSHIYLTVVIYNEGELPVQNINGQWKLLTPNPSEKRVRDIRRDFLGKREKYTDRYRIEESANWRREGIRFDVEVEFLYAFPGERDPQRYTAQYRYDPEKRQMLKNERTLSQT